MARRCLKIPVHIICMVLITATERKDHKKMHGICFLVMLSSILVEDESDICFPSRVSSLVERIT